MLSYLPIDIIRVDLPKDAALFLALPTPVDERIRISHTILMALFKYARQSDEVTAWHGKWSEWFQHIVIHGSSLEDQLDELSGRDLTHSSARMTVVLLTIGELMLTLQQFKPIDIISCVLHAHDDAI